MHTSNTDTQLFRSTKSGQVIKLPRNTNDRVTFLFSEATREQMVAWGWDAIAESHYLGDKPRVKS